MSTVTASLNGLSSADVVVTVSASAVDPAVANDFTRSGNRELTIEAGQLESTGTVTVTAVNNGVDAPSKTVEVTPEQKTVEDDEGAPTVKLALDHGVCIPCHGGGRGAGAENAATIAAAGVVTGRSTPRASPPTSGTSIRPAARRRPS